MTVPLGVLKADTVAFSPPLPRAKAEAIRRLGFGTIVKVVMAFAPSDVFWDDRPDFLGGVAAEGEARGAFFLYVNAQRTDGVRPAVLVAICSGDAAAALDGGADDRGGGDDDELARAALAKLHRMRTRGAAPAPPPRRRSTSSSAAGAASRRRAARVLERRARRLGRGLRRAGGAGGRPPLLRRRAHEPEAAGERDGRRPLGVARGVPHRRGVAGGARPQIAGARRRVGGARGGVARAVASTGDSEFF